MSYTIHPKVPEVRMEAVRLVKYEGWSTRKVALHFGYDHSSVVRWLKRKPEYGKFGRLVIPTISSRPMSHPQRLDSLIVQRILELRRERNQCAEILHHRLAKEGIMVSLSSVKRTLKRHGLTRYSKWKKWHTYPPRPLAEKPGFLVQIDTIFDGSPEERLYVYTLLDVCSRWAFSSPSLKVNTFKSIAFFQEAVKVCPFSFQTLQSDHGQEFSRRFTDRLLYRGVSHRHSRVRTPTDNAHLERFNLTLQRECLSRVPRSLKSWRKGIPEYLEYYNRERPHMGLDYKTPLEVVQSY
jgi:transposase InsO family protein